MRLLLCCDAPAPNAISQVSGVCCIRGWAAPKRKLLKIAVSVDGAPVGTAFYGFARPDVLRSQPNLGPDDRLGFAFRLDTTKLPVGIHDIKVTAIADGETACVESRIEVIERTRSCGMAFAEIENVADCQWKRSESEVERDAQRSQLSILIFTRNQAAFVDRALSIISRQQTSLKFEVIGLDTESDDGTPQVFKRYGARLISVRSSDFHHMRTRLRGLSETSTDLVVFLVGDAVPADEYWLDALVQPLLEDTRVAASYSRQIPTPDCVPWEARDIHSGCPVVREVKHVDWSRRAEVANFYKHVWKFIAFSDVSACYRRSALESLPHLEALPEVEDQYWCKCLLERGYRVVYEPTSVVIHSHNHSLRQMYRRQIKFGRCFATFMTVRPQSLGRILFHAGKESLGDLIFLAGLRKHWGRKLIWAAQAPFMRIAKSYALNKGFRLGTFEAGTAESTLKDTPTDPAVL